MSLKEEELVQFPRSGQKRHDGGAGAGEEGFHSSGVGLQPPDLRRLISIFRRRLRLFTAVALLVFLGVVIVTLRATPLYTTSAAVMLDPRKEQVSNVQDVLSGLPADSSVVDTEVEVLKSRQLAERVVTALKLDQDPEFNGSLRKPSGLGALIGGVKSLFSSAAPDSARARLTAAQAQAAHEHVVDAVLGGLSVRRSGLTYVMNVSYTSPDPAKAALMANTFADRYLLEQLEAKFDATRQANTWLNERLGELRGQVQEAEAAVEQYKIANNLLSASGASLTEQEISAYNQSVAQARAQQAEQEAKLRTAETQLAKGSNGEDVGAALDSPVIQQLRAQRATASGKLADLSGRYGPRHPEMLKAQRELQDIDGQIQAEIKRIISNLQAQAQVAQQRTASIAGSLGGAKGMLAQNNRASVRLRELERNAEAVRTLYESFLNRFKETSAQQGVGTSDARVVSRAKTPSAPSSPRVGRNILLGFLLAIGAGLAASAVAEFLNTGLTTAEDVENRLGVAHLGSLPHLSSVAEDRSTSPVEYVVTKPLSSFAEAFRALRNSVRYSRLGETVKTVMVSSSLPGEGKTTTTVCLGRAAAQAGDRVVIVDCDLRRRNINRLIGMETEKGLLEVLAGDATLDQVLLEDEESGAFILPLAHSSFTPKDVFGTPAMDRLLATLSQRFDLVLLDTAPALAVADTRALAARADAVVFLARWRRTPAKAVETSLKMFASAGAHIAGVALTQVNMKEQARYGYGDPGYYYAEYKKYYSS